MAANYLHGVETTEVERGPRPIRVVKSAVIGLIGCAPSGPVNEPILCLSEKDAAQFGNQHVGFSIPQALDAIYDHGHGTVIVINVFNPETHKSTVTDEAVTLVSDHVMLQNSLVSNVVLKSGDGASTYQTPADFTVDAEKGVLKLVSGGGIQAGTTNFKVSYDYADASKVTPAEIIGAVNAAKKGPTSGVIILIDYLFRNNMLKLIPISIGICPYKKWHKHTFFLNTFHQLA